MASCLIIDAIGGDGEVVAYILHFMFRISSIIYTPLAATTTSSLDIVIIGVVW